VQEQQRTQVTTAGEAIRKVKEGGGFLGAILVAEIDRITKMGQAWRDEADYWRGVAERYEAAARTGAGT
jgi:hypothetical protein